MSDDNQYREALHRLARDVEDQASALGLRCVACTDRMEAGLVIVEAWFDLLSEDGEPMVFTFSTPIDTEDWQDEQAVHTEWLQLLDRLRGGR